MKKGRLKDFQTTFLLRENVVEIQPQRVVRNCAYERPNK